MSKWIGGYSRFLEEDIPEHVQAYFQVIEQRMLHSEEFMNFWDNMQVPESYGDAIKNFEVEFTQYFGKKRIPVSYLDGGNGGGALLHNNEVVYMLHAGDLIDSYGFPILKKRPVQHLILSKL